MHVTLVIMSGLQYRKDPQIIRTKTLQANVLKEPDEIENNVEADSTEFLKSIYYNSKLKSFYQLKLKLFQHR